MSGGVFVGVEKHLIGGITDATKGLMMSYSSMMMGLAVTSATIYIMWRGYQTLAGKLSTPMEDTMWDIMRMAIILPLWQILVVISMALSTLSTG